RVDAIAKSLGLHVQHVPADDTLSCFLLRDRGKTIIGINSNQHPNRQNFTLAHELAHFLLHDTEQVHVDRQDQWLQVRLRDDASSQGTSPEEVEANTFAAELLMPAEFLKADVANCSTLDLLDEVVMDDVLKSLAKRYGVSTQALTYRLLNLNLIQ